MEQDGDRASSAVTVVFTLTHGEFIAAVRRIQARTPFVQVFLVIVAGYVAYSAFVGLGALLVAAVLAVLFLGSVFGYAPVRQWRRNAAVRAEQRLTFSDAGVSATTLNADASASWRYYRKYVRSGPFHLLRVRDLPLWGIIPTRAFASPSDERAFADLVREHLGSGS